MTCHLADFEKEIEAVMGLLKDVCKLGDGPDGRPRPFVPNDRCANQ